MTESNLDKVCVDLKWQRFGLTEEQPITTHRNDSTKIEIKPLWGQKIVILTRQDSRPNVFYFLPTAHFLKQLSTHIAHIAKAPQANPDTKALSKNAIANALKKH